MNKITVKTTEGKIRKGYKTDLYLETETSGGIELIVITPTKKGNGRCAYIIFAKDVVNQNGYQYEEVPKIGFINLDHEDPLIDLVNIV